MKQFLGVFVVTCASHTLFAGEWYYPKDAISDFEQEWYGEHLAAMKEPVIHLNASDVEYFAYRVLYLPTWGPPVSVRISKGEDKVTSRAIMLSGQGGYSPGTINEEKNEELDLQEMDALLSELESAGFFSMDTKDDVMGTDGSQLIIEVIRNGKYSVIVRWTPSYKTEERGLSDIVRIYSQQFEETGFWSENEER